MCESIIIRKNEKFQQEEFFISKKGLTTFPFYEKIVPEINSIIMPYVSIQKTVFSRMVDSNNIIVGPLLFKLPTSGFQTTPTNIFPTLTFTVVKTIECLSARFTNHDSEINNCNIEKGIIYLTQKTIDESLNFFGYQIK
jgi:hypothetical protein